MRNLLLLAVTTAAFAAAGIAAAQAPAPPAGQPRSQRPPAEIFKEWDINGDGGVSKEEWLTTGPNRTLARYNELDANKDGHISLEELAVGMAQQQRDREAAARK